MSTKYITMDEWTRFVHRIQEEKPDETCNLHDSTTLWWRDKEYGVSACIDLRQQSGEFAPTVRVQSGTTPLGEADKVFKILRTYKRILGHALLAFEECKDWRIATESKS